MPIDAWLKEHWPWLGAALTMTGIAGKYLLDARNASAESAARRIADSEQALWERLGQQIDSMQARQDVLRDQNETYYEQITTLRAAQAVAEDAARYWRARAEDCERAMRRSIAYEEQITRALSPLKRGR